MNRSEGYVILSKSTIFFFYYEKQIYSLLFVMYLFNFILETSS